MVDGHYVATGCDVGTSIYSIHHNRNYFHEPFTFNPDRWLDNRDNATKSTMAESTMLQNEFDAYCP